jgi:hypothetical protein
MIVLHDDRVVGLGQEMSVENDAHYVELTEVFQSMPSGAVKRRDGWKKGKRGRKLPSMSAGVLYCKSLHETISGYLGRVGVVYSVLPAL